MKAELISLAPADGGRLEINGRDKMTHNTNAILSQQIREKEMKRESERREEQLIANQYKQDQIKYREEEE